MIYGRGSDAMWSCEQILRFCDGVDRIGVGLVTKPLKGSCGEGFCYRHHEVAVIAREGCDNFAFPNSSEIFRKFPVLARFAFGVCGEKTLSLYKYVQKVKVLDVFFGNRWIFLKTIFRAFPILK
jgi:hypothetical protein